MPHAGGVRTEGRDDARTAATWPAGSAAPVPACGPSRCRPCPRRSRRSSRSRRRRTPARPARQAAPAGYRQRIGDLVLDLLGRAPGQSVKTMTWLSDRSGMASIGTVRSAQYPQPATNRKPAMMRNRLRSDTSMSQWIMRASPLLRATPAPSEAWTLSGRTRRRWASRDG